MATTTCLLASTDWCSRVGAALYDFCQSGVLCDAIIHTKDDQRLSAHANVLAAASPVLKAHIAGCAARPYNLMMSDISSMVALKLLQFIYSGTLQIDISDVTEVSGVMEAASLLQLDTITSFCAESLLKKGGSDVCVEITNEEEFYGVSRCEDVKTADDAISICNGSTVGEHEVEKEKHVENTKEARCRRTRTTPVGDCNAPNTGYGAQQNAFTQDMETNDVNDADLGAEGYRTGWQDAADDLPDKPYGCAVCGRRFNWRRSLRRHTRTHTDERPYVCECGLRFRYTDNLVVHRRTHTGERPFPCSACDRRFKSRLSLSKHLQRLHPGVTLPAPRSAAVGKRSAVQPVCLCSECGKTFSKNKYLLRHKRIHSGVRPYSCDTCGKQFRDRGNLQTHERIHRGEKPYLCSVCGRAFLDQSSCRRHEKIHSSQRPHTCQTCGKGYIQKYAFTIHQRTHRPKTPTTEEPTETGCSAVAVIAHVAEVTAALKTNCEQFT